MRISELADASGIPVPTLKFYLREGLLPRGSATSATRADYGDVHVRRLALIEALTELGGLSLRDVAAVLASIGRAASSPVPPLDLVHRRDDPASEPAPHLVVAAQEVDRFVDEELRWHVDRDAPARRDLARALVAIRRSGRQVDASIFRPYARAASWLVTEPLEAQDVRAGGAEHAVIAAVAADVASVALRRMAQAHLAG